MTVKEYVFQILEALLKQAKMPLSGSVEIDGQLEVSEEFKDFVGTRWQHPFLDYIRIGDVICFDDEVSPDDEVLVEDDWGGSEGIYIDCYLCDGTNKKAFLTLKTLREDPYSRRLMEELANDIRREAEAVLTYKIQAETADISRNGEILFSCKMHKLADVAKERALDGAYYVSCRLTRVGCYHYFVSGTEVTFRDNILEQYAKKQFILQHMEDFGTGIKTQKAFVEFLELLEINKEDLDSLYAVVWQQEDSFCGIDNLNVSTCEELVGTLWNFHFYFYSVEEVLSYYFEREVESYEVAGIMADKEFLDFHKDEDLHQTGSGNYVLRLHY